MQFIDTSREGLGHILSDNSLFVPTYQRSYAWKADHVDSLLEDLAGAIRKKPDSGRSDYFLGSVVAIKRNTGLEIVDGQQRLATTSLIIAAIRDQFLDANDLDMAANIERDYLRRFDMKTRETPARLKLNELDNGYYLDWAIARPSERKASGLLPTRTSHYRIRAAYGKARKYFKQLWEQYSKADASEVLTEWIGFLRDHAQVIRVTVEDAADAYVIFETLNDRGLELSTSDLLKNYLFGRSGDRVDEAQAHWHSMVGALDTVGKKDISVDYIRQLWGSMYGLTRKRELFYKIKEEVTNQRTALDLSVQLDENAKLYAAILNPNHQLWSQYGTEARRALTTLRILRMDRLRPMLLSILNAFPQAEVKKALRWLVAASVRLNTAGGGSAGTAERALASTAVRIRSKEISTTKDLATALTQEFAIIPSDQVFERQFAVARVNNAPVARYYLRALEEAFVGTPGIYTLSDSEDDLNLEHVLPERGRGNDWDHVSEERANSLCRRIGNMVLLNPKVNAQLESKGFAKKVEAFKKSENTRLTKALAEKYSEWGEDQINEWQVTLAKLAVKAWALDT